MGQSRSYEYEAIGASQPNYRLTAEGGTGDYLRSLIVSITNAVTGTVTIRDGDGPTIPIVPTGTAVGTYVIPIKAVSNTGRWSVTTGAGATVIAVHQATPRIPVAWTIADIFSSGEIGVHLDPSDLSTLYQDATGVTPGAVGSVVGLMLDKSKGLVLGSEIFPQPTFDASTGLTLDAAWSIAGGVATANGTTGFILVDPLLTIGKRYYYTITVTARTGGAIYAPYDGAGANIRSISAAGTYTGSFTATTTALRIYSNSFAGSIDNVSVKELPGYHASQSSAGSKPILRQDANGRYYLEFDGVDDFLVTPSIDFSGTDKMFVCAGVRKIAPVATEVIAELGPNFTTSLGAFALVTNGIGAGDTYFGSSGSAFASVRNTAFTPPATLVVSGIGSISGDICRIRINSGNQSTGTTDQGTGNYGNYVMYIGRRGGTTLPFNGRLYGLVVAGLQASDAQVLQTEQYMNARTGAY